ncbi:MAG: hypothetical protein DIU68_013515 [Chloroflexota bacterium]
MNYSICVKGHLDHDWSDWLGSVEIRHLEDGTTVLRGSFPDQAALIATLTKLNDLGITVISVGPAKADCDPPSAASQQPPDGISPD